MTGRSLLDEAADTPTPRDPWKDGYNAAKRYYGTGAQAALGEVERGVRRLLATKPPPSARHQLEALIDTITTARSTP